MKYFLPKIKKHIKTLVQFVVVFGAAFVVLLYFLGYFDLSFLDRYAIFDLPDESTETGQTSPFPSIDMSDETSESGKTDSDSPETSQGSAETAPNDDNSQTQTTYASNVAAVHDPEDLADKLNTIPTVSARLDDGFTVANGDGTYIYDSSRSALAKITFDFKLPTKYSSRSRSVIKETVFSPWDSGEDTSYLISDESYVVAESVSEERPSIEPYMGYIILDDGESFYILSSDGIPLCRYDADRYIPAYTRDREDRPLFTRTEDDGTVHYFYLEANENGIMSFVLSDYDPLIDNRGLYFDYPASWGKSDSTSVFVISQEFARINGSLVTVDSLLADLPEANEDDGISEAASAPDIPTETLFGYEVRNAEGYVVGRLTNLKFTTAYPFMQNRAAVTTADDRGSIYFINENGYRAFVNTQTYVNEHVRYVTEYLLPPLTDGIESIGSYYYDHGLVRVRRQIIDYYNYEVRGLTRVVKDYDCLLRLDGTEYTLPAGYELESYSDGIAVLSKNGLFGVYDVVGEWIAQPIYTSASACIGGLSVLTLPDGRCGMIDKSGNIVLPFTYDSISQVSSGIIAAYRSENGWSVYKIMDKEPVEE